MRRQLPKCECGGRLASYGRPRPNPRWRCLACGKVYAAAQMTVLCMMDEESKEAQKALETK